MSQVPFEYPCQIFLNSSMKRFFFFRFAFNFCFTKTHSLMYMLLYFFNISLLAWIHLASCGLTWALEGMLFLGGVTMWPTSLGPHEFKLLTVRCVGVLGVRVKLTPCLVISSFLLEVFTEITSWLGCKNLMPCVLSCASPCGSLASELRLFRSTDDLPLCGVCQCSGVEVTCLRPTSVRSNCSLVLLSVASFLPFSPL